MEEEVVAGTDDLARSWPLEARALPLLSLGEEASTA